MEPVDCEEMPMPVIYLTENEVRQVLTMDLALEAVEAGLRKVALDEAVNIPRARCQTDLVMLHVLPAAAKSLNALGLKTYTTTKNGAQFWVHLFDSRTGHMTAIVQADFLGQMRTGAASGVATKYMASTDAETVGLYGTGKQARTQLMAVCKVRSIRKVHVFSPNEERRRQFAKEMSDICQTEVVPVSRPQEAAANLDIVITATSSREPVLFGDWLSEGAHLNIVGSNFHAKREIDVATVRRASVIVLDSKEQARLEAGDLVQALDDGVVSWSDMIELPQVIVGRYKGREHPQDITLFKSLGLGIEDVAVAVRVVAKAREAGLGQILPIG